MTDPLSLEQAVGDQMSLWFELRRHKWGHALKIRQSGAPGVLLADESAYLEEHPEKAAALCAGVVVVC